MRMARTQYIIVAVLLFLWTPISNAQPAASGVGAGISFGAATPVSDVTDARQEPFARIFLRYYPSNFISVEAGGGMALLEAESNTDFFSSILNPVDVRVRIQAPVYPAVSPFAFAGVGLLSFNPQDKSGGALPRNAAGAYSKVTTFLPVGAGLQWFFEKNTAVELEGSYHLAMTQNLDDIQGSKNDSYWGAGVNLFAFFGTGDGDSDGDGLSDRREEEMGTNPNIRDTDGDGISDGDEVRVYRTDPRVADTDHDGLKDGEEVFTDRTDPNRADTDGDGLTDGQEVLTYHTNPNDPDTDHGGITDGTEVNEGKNPLDPADDAPVKTVAPPPTPQPTKSDVAPAGALSSATVGAMINFPGVTFEEGKAILTADARTRLETVAKDLIANPDVEIRIEGYTNNVGSRKSNISLSMNRAFAVKTFLESQGVNGARITTKGFGPDKPIADNKTAEGRAKNRRIEFIRTK